eukprot:tig00020944_g16366.t1
MEPRSMRHGLDASAGLGPPYASGAVPSDYRRRIHALEEEVMRLHTDLAASRAENAVLQRQAEKLVGVVLELFKRTLEFCGPAGRGLDANAAWLQAQMEGGSPPGSGPDQAAKPGGEEATGRAWAMQHALESAKDRARREIELTKRRIAEIQKRSIARSHAQVTPPREEQASDLPRQRLGSRFESAHGPGSAHASPDAPTVSFRSEAWGDHAEPARRPAAPPATAGAGAPKPAFRASEGAEENQGGTGAPGSPALSAGSTTSFGASSRAASVDGGRVLLWSSRRGSEASVTGGATAAAAASSSAAAAAALAAARASEFAGGRVSAGAEEAEEAAAAAVAAAEAAEAYATGAGGERLPDGGIYFHDGATTDGGSSYADSFRDFSGLSPAASNASTVGRTPRSLRRTGSGGSAGAGGFSPMHMWARAASNHDTLGSPVGELRSPPPAPVPEGDEGQESPPGEGGTGAGSAPSLVRDIFDLASPPYTPSALDAVLGTGPDSEEDEGGTAASALSPPPAAAAAPGVRPLPPPLPSTPPGPTLSPATPPPRLAPAAPPSRPADHRRPERSGFPFDSGPVPPAARSSPPSRSSPAAPPEAGRPRPRTPGRADANVSLTFADLRTRPPSVSAGPR